MVQDARNGLDHWTGDFSTPVRRLGSIAFIVGMVISLVNMLGGNRSLSGEDRRFFTVRL